MPNLSRDFVARDYIETTTAPVYGGLTDNMPRLDYTDATCPSLLLEPERTNLLENSEYLIEGSTGWTNEGSPDLTISLEEVTTPDGGSVAYKHTANATNSRLQNALGDLGADHTYSIFVKGTGVATTFRLRNNQGNDVTYNIDANGDFTYNRGSSTSYDIEDYGNGWKRIWMVTTTSSSSTNFVQLYADSAGGSGSVYIWGAQAEAGSYPTSYIPTYGSAQTRPADDLTSTPLSIDGLFGATSGSVFMEFTNPLQGLSNNWFYAISEDGDGKYMRVRNYWQFNFTYLTFDPSPNLGNLTNATKVAVKWGGGVIKLFTDGEEEAASTYTGGDINMNGTLTSLNGSFNFAKNDAKFKNIMFFPTALSDDECIALTTL